MREHDVDRLRELGLAPAIDYLVRCDLAVFQGGDFLLHQAKKMVENMDVLAKLELSREVLDEAIKCTSIMILPLCWLAIYRQEC